MKQKFAHILTILIACLGLLVYTAQAQEEVGNEPEEKELKEINTRLDFNLGEDKTLIFEPDQSKDIPTQAKDIIAPTKAKATKAHAEKEEDDALSFNFLYYIINKFKISDIVDN